MFLIDSDGEVEEFLPNITQNVIEELEKAGELFQECFEPPSLNAGDLSLPNGICLFDSLIHCRMN